MIKIAVLVSGGGTNLQALIDKQKEGKLHSGKIALVLSSNREAFALERAKTAGIQTDIITRKLYSSQGVYDDAIVAALQNNGIDLVVLAGFMSILGKNVIDAYRGRIINVHPSLIPSFCGSGFYGLKVHEAALAHGVKVTGATVHLVNEVPDGGKILLQKAVDVEEGDTAQSLQKRVMEQAEWEILPQATAMMCDEIENYQKRCVNMKAEFISDELRVSTYPGRGIIMGRSSDGEKAVIAYFIMGRSVNSRNRIFVEQEEGIRTEAFDPAKLTDPSLVIYSPVRTMDDYIIVTNGDQTDTIWDFLKNSDLHDTCDGVEAGNVFETALLSRTFEPDVPNFTPRISALMKGFRYKFSILKTEGGNPDSVLRFSYRYDQPLQGVGHFIHTYKCDGDPIPSFEGEPTAVKICDDIDTFTSEIWNSLNEENKVSLFTRFITVETGETETRIVNKNKTAI